MKALQGTMLGLVLAVGGLMCHAQNTSIPFREIERDARLSAMSAPPANEASIGRGDEMLARSSSTESSVFLSRVPKPRRTLSPGFFVMNGLHLGLGILDVELTQHCIANHHCVEGNPLSPSSHAGQLSMNFALAGYGTFVSYRLKKRDSRLWILSPIVGIGAHTAGAATGIAHW